MKILIFYLDFIPFQGLEKGIVLQEQVIFNETPLNPKRCCQLLTKCLYLVSQGDRFTKTEATNFFFGVTKLFQSKDVILNLLFIFIFFFIFIIFVFRRFH
jgi:coatomer protein complex subunit gamma